MKKWIEILLIALIVFGVVLLTVTLEYAVAKIALQ